MAGVLACGIAVLDIILALDHFPTKATKYRTSEAAITGGGCAASAAVAVARLGGESTLISRLGDDQIGDIIVSELESENVDCGSVFRIEGAKSSFSSILVDSAGERQIVNFRDSNLPETLELQIKELSKTYGSVIADNRWTFGAGSILHDARINGIPGILDAEYPMDKNNDQAIYEASHIAFASDGLDDLVGINEKSVQLKMVQEKYGNWCCVTDGENGVWWTEKNDIEHMPAFDVDVVDTLGAGDTWHGAFALALAEGLIEKDAIRFASAAAAIKCGKFGGRKGIPTRIEVEEFLKER